MINDKRPYDPRLVISQKSKVCKSKGESQNDLFKICSNFPCSQNNEQKLRELGSLREPRSFESNFAKQKFLLQGAFFDSFFGCAKNE